MHLRPASRKGGVRGLVAFLCLFPSTASFGQAAFQGFKSIQGVPGFAVPNPEIAVGLDAVVVMSNQEIRVYTKAGALLASGRIGNYPGQPPGLFPTPLGALVGSPEVLYDLPGASPRYWMAAAASSTQASQFRGQVALAVSNAGVFWGLDPWLFSYVIDLPDPPFPPGGPFDLKWETNSTNIAVDEEWVYVNGFVVQHTPTSGPTWTFRNITFIYPKAPLLIGDPLPAPKMVIEPPIGQQPTHAGIEERAVYDALANNLSNDAGVPQYMIRPRYHEFNPFQVIDLSYIDMSGSDPVKVDYALILPEAAQYRIPGLIPQRPGAFALATTNARFWAPPVYRDGFLWATHHVRPVGGDRTIIRWYKFAMNGWGPVCPACVPTLAAWGTIDPGGNIHAAFPSLGVDSQGLPAITYTRGSPDAAPSMWIARTDHSTGLFEIQQLIKESEHPWQFNESWGVHSGCDADPVVPGRFWGHGQFVMDQLGDPTPGFQHWRTWVAPVGP